MKKILPFILVFFGISILVGVYLLQGKKDEVREDVLVEESQLINLPFEKLPYISLTPSQDGHYLKFRVENIKIENAKTLDFELLYQVPGDRPPQGVPGTNIDISEKDSFETDLLLGSESSGVFRYDEGVREGTISLKFRDKEGRLITKVASDFHLQANVNELTSLDGKFRYKFEKAPKKGFFVVMNTLGIPKKARNIDKILEGPYGIFSSLQEGIVGEVSFDVDANYFRFDGEEWINVKDKSQGFGIFVASGN